jgi:hypothetical protein
MRYTQKHPQHTYTKRDVYYFSRVIPSDLRNHYTKPRIIQSLKTKSVHRASVASLVLDVSSAYPVIDYQSIAEYPIQSNQG